MTPYLICGVALAMVSMVTAQAGTGTQGNTGGMSQCQQTFLTKLYECIKTGGLDTNNFLHMVTNKSDFQAATDEAGFKKQACGKQETVARCIYEFVNELMNSSMCTPSASSSVDQRPLIGRQFISLVGSYDMLCAHPCRQTLFKDLRECYTEAHLDPDLFLSNATMGRGAVIGTTNDEARSFCKYKDALIKCMKSKRDDCPDSPRMLGMIGLDIDSMEAGVTVLCKHTDLYLEGIDCFSSQTKAIEGCMDKQRESMMNLMVDIRQNNLPEPEGQKRFCEIRLDHVDCDMGGWKLKKHKACTKAVLGLRTELECGLLSQDCVKSHQTTVDKICHVDNFNRGGRIPSVASDTTTISMATMLVMTATAVIFNK